MDSWVNWLAGQVAASTMRVEQIPLSQVNGWGMQNEGDHFGRPDGKFFQLVGAQTTTGAREVTSWGQPLLKEVGGEGAVVLIVASSDDGLLSLVQARPEPGNDSAGCVLLGPTLQASRSNLDKVHGGKRPPRAELLDVHQVEWFRLPCDGGRFLNKYVNYAVVNVDQEDVGPLNPNERWFDPCELREARAQGLTNQHLLVATSLLL